MNAIVVVPTYNELENVGKLVEAIRGLPDKVHILIVDDNSPDGTGRVPFANNQIPTSMLSSAALKMAALIPEPNQGTGIAKHHVECRHGEAVDGCPRGADASPGIVSVSHCRAVGNSAGAGQWIHPGLQLGSAQGSGAHIVRAGGFLSKGEFAGCDRASESVTAFMQNWQCMC